MRTFSLLLVIFCAVFVCHFFKADGFSFPSILDDAREAMKKFSTGPTTVKHKITDKVNTHSVVSTWKPVKYRKISWGRRRRRAPPPKKRPTYKTKPSKTVYRTKPSNNFYEVLGKIERSILEAQASGNKIKSLKRLTKAIRLAMTKKNHIFARKTLGQALYKTLKDSRKLGKRSFGAVNHGANYLKKLKKELGEKAFNKLIGFSDDKTLIFAIDDTGSMGGEIQAVKQISTAIVKKLKHKSGVDYILSVFNDPTVGPTKMFEDGTKMITALNNLRAHAGGDYPELTFTGMQRALELGPQEGSPMFVFTDATAKDVAKYKEIVISSAKDFGININFLIRGPAAKFSPFVEAARETCGMILQLTNSNEIKKLTDIAMLSLKNYACMKDEEMGGKIGKKRSLPRSHVISVDDSISKMIISVSTENSNPIVTLRNPRGQIQYTGKISLFNAILYELKKPMAGRWTLYVDARAGKYRYLVRGSGDRNIDFDYYFVMKGRARDPWIPVSQPLSGQSANTIVTITGAEKLRPSSLRLDVVDIKSGSILKTLTLRQRKRSKEHFLVSFSTPAMPFRLTLRGTTKGGKRFERLSRKTIKPLTAIVRVYKSLNGLLALPRGRRMYVIMKIYNNGNTEKFDVSLNDPLGYAIWRRKQSVKVYKGRWRRFMIWFKASRAAKPGTGCPIAVTIKGRKSGVVAGQVLNMIVQ